MLGALIESLDESFGDDVNYMGNMGCSSEEQDAQDSGVDSAAEFGALVRRRS